MQRSNWRRAGRAISSKPQQGRDVSAINKVLGASLVLPQHPACYKAGGANCTAFTQPKQVVCQHLTPAPSVCPYNGYKTLLLCSGPACLHQLWFLLLLLGLS